MSLENRMAAIPFGALIGEPLNAAIEAQAKAAMSSVEFIRTVGFKENGEVVNVSFTYGDETSKQTLHVPLLTMVPIPFIRIENMSIQFKASMSESTASSKEETESREKSLGLEVSASHWLVKAKMNASVSSKKDSKATEESKYSVEYNIDVNVNAVQDDIPAGMARLLNTLNDSIERQQLANAPKKDPKK